MACVVRCYRLIVMVQGTVAPLSVAVQVVGRGIPDAVASEKPNVVDAPAASVPFHEALLAVSLPFVTDPVAFHIAPTGPAHGKDTDHAEAAVERPFLTVTSTVRPVPQSLTALTVTVTAPAPGTGVGVGVGVGVGAGVGAGAVRVAQ